LVSLCLWLATCPSPVTVERSSSWLHSSMRFGAGPVLVSAGLPQFCAAGLVPAALWPGCLQPRPQHGRSVLIP
jgi:hypothetical protein